MFIFNLKVDIKIRKLFGFDISENPFKQGPQFLLPRTGNIYALSGFR